MANYKVFISKTAEKALCSIPSNDCLRLIKATKSLASNPYPTGCRKLTGMENVFRIRVGPYRIIYEIIQKTISVTILKIGHRKDVYR
jgi:mRNA interferase RelE/StbE